MTSTLDVCTQGSIYILDGKRWLTVSGHDVRTENGGVQGYAKMVCVPKWFAAWYLRLKWKGTWKGTGK